MSEKLLTIGMSTYDDFNGVYFSVQALRMYHDIVNTDQVEILVLDNNPSSQHGSETKSFIEGWAKGRYIPLSDTPASFNKYKIANHANGKYILIIDSHVLLEKNAIDHLLSYYTDNPDCKNLIQGPLLYDDLSNYSTEFKKEWSGDMFGVWGNNAEGYATQKPFEIYMQGMGLCSFEKKNWPGISPHFKGFGGEEGYIAEKFRRNGGQNICIPQLRWVHRFGRPDGVPYPLILEDRIWNYFIGWLEITQDPDHPMIKDIYNYFEQKIPPNSIDNIFYKAKECCKL